MPDYRKYWNPERETMSSSERRALQTEKLAYAVGNAYHNAPIIKQIWDDEGVSPSDIETLEDLREAPFFRKRDVRRYMNEHGDPYGGRRVLPKSELTEGGAVAGSTSGTTGTPTNVVLSARDRDVIAECEARLFWEAGLRPGDNFFSWGPYHHLGSLTFQDGAEKIGTVITRTELSPAHIERAIHFLQRFEPKMVKVVTDPIIDAMDRYFDEHDMHPDEVWGPVESVCFGGLMLTDSRREFLNREWDVEVFEHGGGSEPHWHGGECREHGGWLHVADDHYFFEVVDPDTGQRLGTDERGELIITALSYSGMGHVRWAHDDIVVMKRGKCACGRRGTRLKIIGRVGEVVEVEGQKLLPYDVVSCVEGLSEMPNNLFQFYSDSTESLRLKIGYSSDHTDNPEQFSRNLQEQLESNLGVPIEIVSAVTEQDIMGSGASYKVTRVIDPED